MFPINLCTHTHTHTGASPWMTSSVFILIECVLVNAECPSRLTCWNFDFLLGKFYACWYADILRLLDKLLLEVFFYCLKASENFKHFPVCTLVCACCCLTLSFVVCSEAFVFMKWEVPLIQNNFNGLSKQWDIFPSALRMILRSWKR